MMSNPHGSCIVCGYDKPYKGWVSDNEGVAVAGICEECLNHARGYAALEAKVEELEKKLEETGNAFDDVFDVNAKCQAQAAAMREALELFVYPVDSLDEYEAHQKGKQALSTDAGKAMLERMRKLEIELRQARYQLDWCKWADRHGLVEENCRLRAVAKEAKKVVDIMQSDERDRKELFKALTWLDAALAALEEGGNHDATSQALR